MTKQQIINHIATRLHSLLSNRGEINSTSDIVLLSSILQEITRDDDYNSYGQPSAQLNYASTPYTSVSNLNPIGRDMSVGGSIQSLGMSSVG